jgi:nucleotide-binding universal stress UspA family protein
MKVLIAVDTTACSKLAFDDVLADRSWPAGTQFRLISCLEPVTRAYPTALTYVPEMFEAEQSLRRLVEESMSTGLKKLREHFPNSDVDGLVVEGIPADVILTEARKWCPDLIVLGSHGRKGIEHFLFGSVAEKVVREAECAVSILRGSLSATREERLATR